MAAAQALLLAAVLLCCSSAVPTCPESCTCQTPALLNCSSSGLSSLPPHIPDSVTDIDLSDNLLGSVTLDRPRHNLRNVQLGNNSITHLSLCAERHLGGRYVRGRRLHHLRPWSRRGCVSWAPTLQLLSVERNQLELLPDGLEGSESLQVLQLSFNRISNLGAGDLGHLRQLKELHLQHNLITSLHPQTFKDLAQLRVVDLSFNMLTSLHPLMYLSLHNIGADVRLAGNRWKCDCSMRSLRRRMAYDSSRGLQAWSVVCASPSNLSGKDLLQLEEDDLNCFTTENGLERHQDVTVYSGSEILLSCSTQDSTERTPSGQASESKSEAGLLIKDITERDKGLYVCVSEEQEVVSVFNLQISEVGGAQRKARSLPRSSGQMIPQDTQNRIGQERNQRATQSQLALAVCLSILFTFLVAFVLGVLARPCIDVLCKRVKKKKRGTAVNTVSTVEQRHYDNEAYYDNEEQVEVGTHRERRVTFSNVESREDVNVQYYDTVASGDQEIINDDVFNCDAAERNRARDSESDNSSREGSPEDNQRIGRDHSGVTIAGVTKVTEFEHIPDPVEPERKRHSSSSSSDSSLSDKEYKREQMNQRDQTRPKSLQLVEDSIQQTANISTAREVNVHEHEIPGFSSEPFAGWSPHTDHTKLADDHWQQNEEQFEFSDRSTSPRSSSVLGSTLDKQKRDDTSSSSSYLSENETTHYTVNSGREEEDVEWNQRTPGLTQDASFKQQIQVVDAARPSVELDNREKVKTMPTKRSLRSLGVTTQGNRLEAGAPSPPGAYSSSSSSESEAENKDLKMEHKTQRLNVGIKGHYDINAPLPASDSSSSDESAKETVDHLLKQGETHVTRQVPETQRPALVLEHTTHIKSHGDIKAPSPASNSSSSSDSEGETNYTKKQGHRESDIIKPPVTISQAVSHDQEKQLPTLNLVQTTQVKRPLDNKAPSQASDSSSSSDSEEEVRPGKVDIADIAIQKSQTASHVPNNSWPSLDFGHIPRIKRRLDIKATSPASDSSSSSDSENEKANYIQRPGKVGLEVQKSQTGSHVQGALWPSLDLGHIPSVKRRLDIKTTSPASDSSSSSDSENEKANYIQRPGKVGPEVQKSQTGSHVQGALWPSLDLGRIPSVKRRLDIKTTSPASDSSSSSDSENEKANYIQRPGKVGLEVQKSQTGSHVQGASLPSQDHGQIPSIKRRQDIKGPAPPSDSSSSSDSEDETTNHIKKQVQQQTDVARLPITISQTVSHNQETQWPVLDLEQTTHVKRRLDIKARSQSSDSSSSSESEDEAKKYIKKQEQGQMHMATLPITVSPTLSSNPQTRWPLLDLQHTKRIKRRLDITAHSPASDSSSSSDSEDESKRYIERPGKVVIADLAIQKSQTSHVPETKSPVQDLDHPTRIKTTDSSSSSDSEDETTNHIKKQEQGQLPTAKHPIIVSQTVSHDPQTQWPVLNLEQTTRIKRRLDIKVQSQSSDSSSSSESEDEAKKYIKKQGQGQTHLATLPIKESQTVSHDPQTQWPLLDLEHTSSIKRRLDIKAHSPDSDSSSSSDSEDETTHQTQRQGKVHAAELVFQKSPTASHAQETQWPVLDLKLTTRIKRRLDIKAPSPDSSSSSDSEDEARIHLKKQVEHLSKPPTVEPDAKLRWPGLGLSSAPNVKSGLEIKAHSPPSESSSSSDESEGGTTDIHERNKDDVTFTNLEQQTKLHKLSLGAPYIHRRLDIKAPLPQPDPVLSSVYPRSRKSESSSSTSESEDENKEHIERGLGATAISKATQKESIKSPKSPVIRIPSGPKTDSNIKLEKYRVITDDLGEKTTSWNVNTTPEINPELESRWASMTLGTSRFRKRLEITSHAHGPPKVPSSPPHDSPSSSSSESGKEGKSKRTRRKRRVVGLQGNLHGESSQSPEITPVNVSLSLKGQDVSSGTVEFKERQEGQLQKEASSSSSSENDTIDHSVPDLSLGVPRIKRRLNVKAPLPESSTSKSSWSNSENEATGYTAKQSRPALNMPRLRDTDTLITYKRSIFQATSPTSNSPPSSVYTIDDTRQRYSEMAFVAQESPSYSVETRNTKKFSSRSFDDLLKKVIGNSKRTKDAELPPEIRWTGIGRQLPDLATSSPGRRLDVGLSSPPAESELPPPDSSSSSSSESDDEIKQDRGKEDVTPTHKYSSLSAITASSSSTGTLDTVDNSSISTNQILSISEDKRERKGLGALKAMSSQRQEWDTMAKNLDYSASRLFDAPGPQVETTFHYRRSEEYSNPTASQSLSKVYLSSTSVDERRATDLSHGIHRYRGHDVGDIEPPLEAPPPVPATPPPPDEAVGFTWRSRPNSWKQRSEGTRSYLTLSRTTGESDPSSRYFDSSKNPITDV